MVVTNIWSNIVLLIQVQVQLEAWYVRYVQTYTNETIQPNECNQALIRGASVL